MGLPPLVPLTPPPAPSITGGVGTAAKVVLGVASGGLYNPFSDAPNLFGVSASRLIAIIIGLIVLAAAVFSFRPAREVIVGTAKTAAKAAAA